MCNFFSSHVLIVKLSTEPEPSVVPFTYLTLCANGWWNFTCGIIEPRETSQDPNPSFIFYREKPIQIFRALPTWQENLANVPFCVSFSSKVLKWVWPGEWGSDNCCVNSLWGLLLSVSHSSFGVNERHHSFVSVFSCNFFSFCSFFKVTLGTFCYYVHYKFSEKMPSYNREL